MVERYLDCGNPRCGFARIRWSDCGEKPEEVERMDYLEFIAIITDYAMVDRIIHHLKLTFVAERPPPPHVVSQQFFLDSEACADYFS